jgi:cell division protein FtsB
MQVSSWIIFGVAEVMALLLLICGFLLMHTRNLKGLVGRLQDKLQHLTKDLKKTKQAYKEMEASIPEPTSYVDLVDAQLEGNRDYHQTLDPDQDIALDLSPQAPLPRQLASLRHAFLITEKEASLSSDTPNTPNWMVIQAKLSGLMNFFKAESPVPAAPTADNTDELKQALMESQQRVENLEKFKTLFFELDEKWQNAQNQANDYRQQLSEMASEHPDNDNFEALLNRYQNSYDDFDASMQSQSNRTGDNITQVINSSSSHPASDEVDRLKSVAANQHQLISELQQRLEIAYSAADKESVIDDLKGQLDQHLRYMEESDTCIKLLENELDQAQEELTRLRTENSNPPIPPELKEKFSVLKEERMMMNQTIQNLQQENEQLVLQMQATLSEPGSNDSNSELMQEFKQLQNQYTELESKYLELRMKA